jgi:hypothetical protein
MIAEYCEDGEYTHHNKEARDAQHVDCRCGRKAPAQPQWIRTCWQMYTEATEQFYRHAQVTQS